MVSAGDELRQRLAGVLWIGGSTCAGKSSIADIIGGKYGIEVYHYDRHEPDHTARRLADPARYSAFMPFLRMSMDERWVLRSPEAMAEEVIASWTERFPLVIEDLPQLPTGVPLLAEGPGLFPELVQPLLSSPQQAIWLLASDNVIRNVRTNRPSGIKRETSDPDRAIANVIARDFILARYIRDQAERLGLATYPVDWTESLEQVAQAVERHLL